MKNDDPSNVAVLRGDRGFIITVARNHDPRPLPLSIIYGYHNSQEPSLLTSRVTTNDLFAQTSLYDSHEAPLFAFLELSFYNNHPSAAFVLYKPQICTSDMQHFFLHYFK